MDLNLGTPTGDLLGGAQASAGQARLRQLAGSLEKNGETPEGLAKAAKEFEAVFLNQLMKSMRATVPESELFNGGGSTKFYQQMHDAELANALASHNGGMGITELIVRQLSRPEGVEVTPSAAESTGTSAMEILGPLAPSPAAAAAAYRRLGGELSARAKALAAVGAPTAAEADTLWVHGEAITSAAQRHGVPSALVLAVVMEESGGNPQAASPKGAVGLMQLMPATAREVGVDDPRDPSQNLDGGALYLSRMVKRYDGDLELALAAYNAGPGTVDRAGRAIPAYPETERYVEKVMARYHRLGGGTELAIDGR